MPSASLWRTIARPVWTGVSAFAPLSLLATAVTEIVPHTRGVGFVTPLRYAVLTPITLVAAISAVLLYRTIEARSTRPRRLFSIAVLVRSWASPIDLRSSYGECRSLDSRAWISSGSSTSSRSARARPAPGVVTCRAEFEVPKAFWTALRSAL